MENPYRPTYAAVNKLFKTPPEWRPFFDLSVVPNTHELPIRRRNDNGGATRWANLVIGLAIDNLAQRDEGRKSPQTVAAAIRAGRAALWVTLRLAEGQRQPNEPDVQLDGAVNIDGPLVEVIGSDTLGTNPLTVRMCFQKQGDIYVPQEVGMHDVKPDPQALAEFDGARGSQLHAAFELGALEELASGAVAEGTFVVRAGAHLPAQIA